MICQVTIWSLLCVIDRWQLEFELLKSLTWFGISNDLSNNTMYGF